MHDSKLGQTDVVVLEQSQVTSGTTWHAAGLIGVSRASDAETRLCVEGSLLYESLEEETEQVQVPRSDVVCAGACRAPSAADTMDVP